MKNVKSLLIGTIIGLSGLNVSAQNGPSLPASSPAASVSQTFGLTKIEINYSSPAVKGRQIWGALVPYDTIWRTGANQATNIIFSTDVTINGNLVKKGKYALFTIPGRTSWTFILNSDADQFGAFNYDKSLDIARFTAIPQSTDVIATSDETDKNKKKSKTEDMPKPAQIKERMTFLIESTSDTTATVTLWWDKLKVSFTVTANTPEMVEKGLESFGNNSWRTYANAANYNVDNHLDLTKAYQWAQLSVYMKESFYNRYVMAKVLRAQGKNAEALGYANDAKSIGDRNVDGFYNEYKADVAKLIAELSTPAANKK